MQRISWENSRAHSFTSTREMIECFIDWLTDWLTSTGWMNGWLNVWNDFSTGRLIDWMNGRVGGVRMRGWCWAVHETSENRSIDRSVGRSVGRMGAFLVECVACVIRWFFIREKNATLPPVEPAFADWFTSSIPTGMRIFYAVCCALPMIITLPHGLLNIMTVLFPMETLNQLKHHEWLERGYELTDRKWSSYGRSDDSRKKPERRHFESQIELNRSLSYRSVSCKVLPIRASWWDIMHL